MSKPDNLKLKKKLIKKLKRVARKMRPKLRLEFGGRPDPLNDSEVLALFSWGKSRNAKPKPKKKVVKSK